MDTAIRRQYKEVKMTRKERNIKNIQKFELEHQRKPFDLHEVFTWVVENKLWGPPPDLVERKFMEEVSGNLREEYITEENGDLVRYYHAVTRGRQGSLWGNLDTAPKDHLYEAFMQRRRQSLGDCRQLKTDVDYCNRQRFSDTPIQMSFNFDADLAEEAAVKEVRLERMKAAAA